ncbi:hypothetical protein GCM10027347_50940 [Larkinella harenae]
MITKVLPPQKNREINYDNKGSCARLVNYFEHEAKEANGKETFYFSDEMHFLNRDTVVREIDNNVKGLKADDTKFVSLVLCPSEDELKHIKNDLDKLKEFTRTVMDHYAKNFILKDGQQLSGKDLVWYGIVHQTRKYRWDDKDVRSGQAEKGDWKAGFQSHVHVIVSTRDQEQKITLNPHTRKTRFNIINFQKETAKGFQNQFQYDKENSYHKEKPHRERRHIDQVRHFEKRINGISDKYGLERETINQLRRLAIDSGYSSEFYTRLRAYTKRLDQKDESTNLGEFSNLAKVVSRDDREFIRSSPSIQRSSRLGLTVLTVLRGASDDQDDDREILKDLTSRYGRGYMRG